MSAVLRLVAGDRDTAPPILAEPVYYFGRGEPISEVTPHDFAAHLRHYGPRPTYRGGEGDALIDAIDEAKLTGRGGAHLPSAIKWRAVRDAAAVNGCVIVANGAEGEPQSRKDRTLLELRPHLVLDGLMCAAETLGAHRAVIWLHDAADTVHASVARALAERRAARRHEPVVEIRSGPDAYLTGESGAVVRALSGGPALPAFRTVPSAVRGVRGEPTLVHNVETLVHVAQLARGTCPASALVTICVDDSRVVVEARTGEAVRDIVNRVVPSRNAVAVLLGGYGGTWCSWADLAGLCLTEPDLRAHGLSLGAGVLEILGPGSCGLSRAAEIADYLAGQSARQCGPCLFGLRSVADAMAGAAGHGRRSRHNAERIARFAAEIRGRGACHLPDGAVRMAASALDAFAADLPAHARGRCLAGRGRAMSERRRLRVDIVACDGVGICAHLADQLIRVDSWGFPIVDDRPLDGAAERRARAAVTACPRKALFIAADRTD